MPRAITCASSGAGAGARTRGRRGVIMYIRHRSFWGDLLLPTRASSGRTRMWKRIASHWRAASARARSFDSRNLPTRADVWNTAGGPGATTGGAATICRTTSSVATCSATRPTVVFASAPWSISRSCSDVRLGGHRVRRAGGERGAHRLLECLAALVRGETYRVVALGPGDSPHCEVNLQPVPRAARAGPLQDALDVGHGIRQQLQRFRVGLPLRDGTLEGVAEAFGEPAQPPRPRPGRRKGDQGRAP